MIGKWYNLINNPQALFEVNKTYIYSNKSPLVCSTD